MERAYFRVLLYTLFKPGGGRPNTFLNFCPSFMVAGLHAKNWNMWARQYSKKHFFESGINLLIAISKDVCGLKVLGGL
ncbi:hypothetical protein VK72_12845 [Paenibacillus polymyxa]|nr:hypothetical protein VK72_12845 [Paenibacillus polymyxa]